MPRPETLPGTARTARQVDNNASKSAQLLDVIAANVAVFKSNYGYQEWRRACEVCACAHVCVCVCVCERERQREGEGNGDAPASYAHSINSLGCLRNIG